MPKSIAESFAAAAGDNLPKNQDTGHPTALDIESSFFKAPKIDVPVVPRLDMQPAVMPPRLPEFSSPSNPTPGSVKFPQQAGSLPVGGFRISANPSTEQKIEPISNWSKALRIIQKPYKMP